MNAFAYNAALYCEPCGNAIKRDLDRKAADGDRTTGNDDDSGFYPQGPFPNGGGEADCPQHCDTCGAFLENPLTDDGRVYVVEQLRRERVLRSFGKTGEPFGNVLDTWSRFYGIEL